MSLLAQRPDVSCIALEVLLVRKLNKNQSVFLIGLFNCLLVELLNLKARVLPFWMTDSKAAPEVKQ